MNEHVCVCVFVYACSNAVTNSLLQIYSNMCVSVCACACVHLCERLCECLCVLENACVWAQWRVHGGMDKGG